MVRLAMSRTVFSVIIVLIVLGLLYLQTLADLSGVAVNTVVAIERGEGNPQLATLLTILDTLGLQIDINIKQLDYETV